MQEIRCRVVLIDPEGQESIVGSIGLGGTLKVDLPDGPIDVSVGEDGLFRYEDEIYMKTTPLTIDGYTVRPEAEYIKAEPRKHPKGKTCRQCTYWNRKAGREHYYEVVKLSCGAECDMNKAITDQISKDYDLPPVDPNDLGLCLTEDGLESGEAPGCAKWSCAPLLERFRRWRVRHFPTPKERSGLDV